MNNSGNDETQISRFPFQCVKLALSIETVDDVFLLFLNRSKNNRLPTTSGQLGNDKTLFSHFQVNHIAMVIIRLFYSSSGESTFEILGLQATQGIFKSICSQ